MNTNNFLATQQLKLIQESHNVAILPDDKKLRIVSVGKANKTALTEYIEWKKQLISLIKNSDKKALLERLQFVKKQLCPKCIQGLKKFELPHGHGNESRQFITCEYIIRSLKDD